MIMKNLMKNLILLLLVTLITLSCGNSAMPTKDKMIFDDEQTDEYASLRETQSLPQRTPEDLSGKVFIITQQEFIERITEIDNPKGFQYLGQTPCIVELYADWCKPCGFLSILLKELAPEYQGKVIFYKLNIDRAREIQDAFEVKSIPKILYFKPHSEVLSTVGFLNREELKKKIDEILLKP